MKARYVAEKKENSAENKCTTIKQHTTNILVAQSKI
jgi:hypothetical protein